MRSSAGRPRPSPSGSRSTGRPDGRSPTRSAPRSGALAGPDRTLEAADLEVAVLAEDTGRRAFRRLVNGELEALLA